MQYSDEHLRYLRLLSQKYQTVAAAASEIIRIEAPAPSAQGHRALHE